jgi:hypothetical protein
MQRHKEMPIVSDGVPSSEEKESVEPTPFTSTSTSLDDSDTLEAVKHMPPRRSQDVADSDGMCTDCSQPRHHLSFITLENAIPQAHIMKIALALLQGISVRFRLTRSHIQ